MLSKLAPLALTLPLCAFAWCAQAGTVSSTPVSPATPQLTVPLSKACEPYYPVDFEPEESPGTTRLLAYIATSGAITALSIATSSGSVTLDQAAVQCIKALGVSYQPARIGELPVGSWQELNVDWKQILKARPSRPKPEAFFKLN
jgi:TonB family protein